MECTIAKQTHTKNGKERKEKGRKADTNQWKGTGNEKHKVDK